MKRDLLNFIVKHSIILRRIVYLILGKLWFGAKSAVAIYCYHGIGPKSIYYNVAKDDFIEHVEHLSQKGQYWTLSQIANEEYLKNSGSVKTGFSLTFDDGIPSVLNVADYLQAKDIRPTIFVLSEPQNADYSQLQVDYKLMKDEDLKKLIDYGWEVGCHSATHADLALLSDEALEREIVHSKKDLENRLGIAIKYFAYPRGIYNQRVLKKIKEAGYELAVTMDDGVITGKLKHILKVPRIGVDSSHALSEFKVLADPLVVKFKQFIKQFIFGI